ncbi:IS66 family insertion sequence element accessory protein TnpA [Paraglaciecola chathamensis]|uniref:IS66 family insertion sequence element accessory protein TnpA n=1 Tax=Paraglaciecola chathamensis TaxID=368405 RepID=UPI0009FD880A
MPTFNLFAQQKRCGLTAVEFCRQQQINVQTYYTRRRDIRLQRTHRKFVHVKRKVTKIESRLSGSCRLATSSRKRPA